MTDISKKCWAAKLNTFFVMDMTVNRKRQVLLFQYFLCGYGSVIQLNCKYVNPFRKG